MKKWNAPEVAELNISETANGVVDWTWESPHDIALNDSKKPSNPDPDPSTPDDHS